MIIYRSTAKITGVILPPARLRSNPKAQAWNSKDI